jgi:hypothetical protein
LMKPFTPSDLLHKVSSLVRASAGVRSGQAQQSFL